MQTHEAIAFIEKGMPTSDNTPQQWADLGCGSGTFTRALAHLLPPGSGITAVDRSPQALESEMGNGVSVKFQQADFGEDDLRLPELNGILMTNSIHYVRDKHRLIKGLAKHFRGKGQFLIIEYDSRVPNPWVPYPITSSELGALFRGLGYTDMTKINERPSRYGGLMYAASITSR